MLVGLFPNEQSAWGDAGDRGPKYDGAYGVTCVWGVIYHRKAFDRLFLRNTTPFVAFRRSFKTRQLPIDIINSSMDHPSRVLEQAREHLEALKQSGLSRDALLALLEEQPQQQQQQQQQQQHHHQPQQPQNPMVTDAALPNFSYRDINSFGQPHKQRSSISSSRSSCSSRDSVFSAASARSSISSTTTAATDAKFWCTSCDKTFKRKFDWKRHEEEFHERSRKYPCPNCNQSFWGPNTFNQHHKSAHGCKTCPHADTVVKHLRKRRAWGCGFCAAMHGKFEKHIDHVAAHFETGSTKADWLHSNVIYGLLHQHLIHEAWKALIAKKQSKFNGHQPMFSWSPESTGRAQGFVENENPGQLQDLLEFFDGTKESAENIVEMAYTCVHVVFRPRSGSVTQSSPQSPFGPTSPTNASKHISVIPRNPSAPRRSASTSALPGVGRHGRRTTSGDYPHNTVSSQVSNLNLAMPPVPSQQQSMMNAYQSFPMQPAPQQRYVPPSITTDKALPPAPLAPSPTSPMQMDFPIFNTDEGLLPPLDLSSDDWRSFASTLVEVEEEPAHPLSSGQFPMSWEDLGQFNTNS
ncbi:uncharacterized protein F4807DRAFT_450642 [Annulohypoxylon truncatum]|uniref:uncharacterized protein n=1 Tax=Annulohypoxylon truncatum TaxID=327061 RepID=UPI002008EAF8|nr:uncharacterized protein F4807DRAFT_450642 [Annulohypoxylon truncatum]KAI1212018.1 hypothetical protein F4807DRAFT_450642 [Annulohypoxylon truncatum]